MIMLYGHLAVRVLIGWSSAAVPTVSSAAATVAVLVRILVLVWVCG
jgi:hypothetical protein